MGKDHRNNNRRNHPDLNDVAMSNRDFLLQRLDALRSLVAHKNSTHEEWADSFAKVMTEFTQIFISLAAVAAIGAGWSFDQFMNNFTACFEEGPGKKYRDMLS